MNRPAWRWIASTTWGWQWPVEVTAMPPVKSRYSTPSVVRMVAPAPDSTCRSVTENQTSARWDTTASSGWGGPGGPDGEIERTEGEGAAIDAEGGAVGERAGARDEVEDEGGHLVGLADAPRQVDAGPGGLDVGYRTGGHGGADQARVDLDDPDAVVDPLLGQGDGGGGEARLRRSVDGGPGRRAGGVDRPDGDEHTRVRAGQVRVGQLGEAEWGPQVEGHEGVEPGPVELGDREVLGSPGVAHDDVETAERLDGAADHGVQLGVVAQVGDDGDGPAAVGLDGGDGPVERLGASGHDRHVGAGRGEQGGGGAADAGGPPGDERGSTGQVEEL